MNQNEMLVFCKTFVSLLRATPETPLRTKSEQDMWNVVVEGKTSPVEQWWSSDMFILLTGTNHTTYLVYTFIRDNQTLFHKAD